MTENEYTQEETEISVTEKNETPVENEIVKRKIRYRYPWNSLVEVGDSFIIPADNVTGVRNSRQLCYSATKASIRKKENKVFKAITQEDGSIKIQYSSIFIPPPKYPGLTSE